MTVCAKADDYLMPDKTNLEHDKATSLEEGENNESQEILSDSERRAKFGTSRSRKVGLSKREMMEELSRDRFPWEECTYIRFREPIMFLVQIDNYQEFSIFL